jgi:hypothetical protein
MRKTIAFTLMAIAALGACAASADARRLATRRELETLAGSTPTKCIGARVSTVAHGWALTQLIPFVHGCPVGNGFSLQHRTGGRWAQAWGASDSTVRCDRIPGVPAKVAIDLQVCGGRNPYFRVHAPRR